MPDVFALSKIPALTRLRTPELEIAVADDGEDAKASTIAKLEVRTRNLAVALGVLDAVDLRIKLRRPWPLPVPVPPVESLQSLVRRGRRRLERERHGAARILHDLRLDAVTRLRTVLVA